MAKMVEREGMQQLLDGGAQLVEVLPKKEFERIHIAGAINIPLQSLNEQTASRLQKTIPIIVYCFDFQ